MDPPAEGAPPRSPPTSPRVDVRSRRWTVASFWVILLLGVPLWWRTTTLERQPLPEARILDWTERWSDRIPLETAPSRQRSAELDSRVVKFSPHYKLIFSLLNQDSASGSAVLDWNANELLKRHIRPLLSSLSPLHNFTIETHVQYFAPLTVAVNREDEREGSYVREDDLRAFVNNADWNLATGDILDPVLQFLLYVPSAENRPMRIRSVDGQDVTPAFITPQRGGVMIFNPDSLAPEAPPSVSLNLPTSAFAPSFRLFQHQLRTLLGAPTLPSARNSGPLAPAQLDLLVRQRLHEAVADTVETLGATVKLSRDIPNMRISREVQGRVNTALHELDQAATAFPSSPSLALAHAARAQSLASTAYYDPSMLALLYFPDEHKYAVYTPLFGPVAVPLLVALLKEGEEADEKREKGD
ncbi:hypothetical protein Rhopal_002075-T1 [Rhodotorula paludigena]|uniref:Phosphatidylinositol glycan, class S n=1 Tax=Rhodotorula paludigena TaxID=86838 RepID=A0AAV5G936_9BASI|nr:hypothetical protein Rhopal_002075-T1 [Rhodotorula paludigena]